MDILTGSVPFGRAKGSGPRTATADIDFGHSLTKANAVLTGMDFGFSPNDDHHMGMVDIKVDSQIIGNTVRVTASFGVRDWSGTFDDDYEGTVFFAVLAE